MLKLHRTPRVSDMEKANDAAGSAAGDPTVALFQRAVEGQMRRLLAIARGIVGTRASAEDVVQQAIMNLFQHRHRYDWNEPAGLLRRTVVNEALRVLRQPRMAMVADDHPGRSSGEPDEVVLEGELVQEVRQAIDRLPHHFRSALVLCEYENLSYTQIAEVLDCSVPQVKTWLHRGRRQLAVILRPFMEARARARRKQER